jgi:protein involved in polysaccharide export with SLBB domain
MTGCLNTGDQAGLGGSYPPGSSSLSASYPQNLRSLPYPSGQPYGAYGSKVPTGDIRQIQHQQPQAGFGQGGPGKPEEIIIEAQPGVPHGMAPGMVMGPSLPQPGELKMTTLPPHRLAPPDIVQIEALRLIPKGPYLLEPLEVLQIEVADALPKQDIRGMYMISPDGRINLGHTYGSVMVRGLTVEQAQAAIRNHLNPIIKGASVNIALVQMRQMQLIKGDHLVRPDGTIHLGMYGSVYVAGMTLGEAKAAIEQYLGAYLVNPQISIDVKAYNSRKVYIIADTFVNFRQQVIALPVTGNEHVLDAISKVQGLNFTASTKKIWVARPSPAGHPCSQVLPVDWKAITQAGRTETNYQLLPGDRIFIASDPFWCAYFQIDKVLAPFERVLDFTFRTQTVIQSIRNPGNAGIVVVP